MRSLLRRFAPRSGALLHSLKGAWDLRPDDCPCDIHFVEWLEQRRAPGETVFHFGTGGHHHVGIRLGEGDLGASVMGITATRREYDSYIDLVTRRPELARSYCVYFGDIYTANPTLLPMFDVVTLFHLCEFRTEANDAYGALTDLEMVRVFTERTRAGGHLVFYTGSYAYDRAEAVIGEWAATSPVEEIEGFRSLRVFRKRGAPPASLSRWERESTRPADAVSTPGHVANIGSAVGERGRLREQRKRRLVRLSPYRKARAITLIATSRESRNNES